MDAAHTQLVAEMPSAMCGTPEQGAAAAVALSPRCSQCCAWGFMRATAGRSDELALLAARLAYIHGGEPVQGDWWGWVTSMQAAVAGPPEHTGPQLLAKVTHLLHGSWGCWCSCSLCGVRDSAGTATPALASAAGSSKDHKCTINQERS